MSPCSLIDHLERFREVCCLILQGRILLRKRKHHIPPAWCHIPEDTPLYRWAHCLSANFLRKFWDFSASVGVQASACRWNNHSVVYIGLNTKTEALRFASKMQSRAHILFYNWNKTKKFWGEVITYFAFRDTDRIKTERLKMDTQRHKARLSHTPPPINLLTESNG